MTMTKDEYRDAVSIQMIRKYGITWGEASGDDERLKSGFLAGQSPEDFVRAYGEKYDFEFMPGES